MFGSIMGSMGGLGGLASIGNMFMGGKEGVTGSPGSSGQHGIDVAYLDDYDDYAGYRQGLVDYYQGVMQGKEPEWMDRYLPQIQAQQEKDFDRYYLGEGNRMSNSAMGLAGQIGAQTGVGPKATMAAQGGVANELAAKKAAARAAMTQYRANWMGTGQWQAGQGLQALPQGPRTVAAPYSIPGQAATKGGGFESLIPGMQALGGLFGGGGGGGFMSGGNNPGTFGMFNQNTMSNAGGNLGYENTSRWSKPVTPQYGGYDLGFDTSQYSGSSGVTGSW